MRSSILRVRLSHKRVRPSIWRVISDIGMLRSSTCRVRSTVIIPREMCERMKSNMATHLASRDPVRKPASLCKEVEAGRLASTGASST